MGERDAMWINLYQAVSGRAQAAHDQVSAFAWSLLSGEEFWLLGKRCRAKLEWPDGEPMDAERMHAWALEMLAKLRERAA